MDYKYKGFNNRSQLKWHKKDNPNPVEALASPSESEHFIHPTVQYLLKSINLEDGQNHDLFATHIRKTMKISNQYCKFHLYDCFKHVSRTKKLAEFV